MEQNDPINVTPEGGTPPPQGTPPTPQPSTPVGSLGQEEKQWAMFCHLAALAGFIGIPFGNIIGPLIVWLIKKEAYGFVNQQGKEALNFQISCFIYGLLLLPTLCFPPLFGLLIFALVLVDLTFVILASIAASKGESYRYPITIRLIN